MRNRQHAQALPLKQICAPNLKGASVHHLSRRSLCFAFLFNMSRTLSIGKVGPGPDFSGSGPFSISTLLRRLGVSFRRSFLQFNIRPWRISALGNLLAWLGLLSVDLIGLRRGCAGRSQKEPGFGPNGSRDLAAGWDECRDVGLACHCGVQRSTMQPTAQTASEFSGRGDIGLVLWTLRSQYPSRLLH